MTPLNLDIWRAARFTLALTSAVKHAGRHYKDTAKRPFNVSLVGKATPQAGSMLITQLQVPVSTLSMSPIDKILLKQSVSPQRSIKYS